FLQGLVSNDVNKVTGGRAVYAAMLTPQGKFLHDFFIAELEGILHLDCEAERRDDLMRHLARFKLRARVSIEPRDLAVIGLFGAGAVGALDLEDAGGRAEAGRARRWAGGVAFVDPRLVALGARAIAPRGEAERAAEAAGFRLAATADYERVRLAHGVPDGSRDLEVEKSLLLESNFEELNGLDWDKGCYLGQELTARTKYRGLIKRRLVSVTIDGPAPAPGTPVLLGGAEAGVMRTSLEGRGLALLRLEAVESAEAGGAVLEAAAARLRPVRPSSTAT
ncbi:MAG: YgfZ/GcvT domain-containing protein, partial [Alphaproteobacteria bacterium]